MSGEVTVMICTYCRDNRDVLVQSINGRCDVCHGTDWEDRPIAEFFAQDLRRMEPFPESRR